MIRIYSNRFSNVPQFWTTVRPLVVILCFVLIIPVIAEGRVLRNIPTPHSIYGVTARLTPGKSGANIKAMLQNAGTSKAYVLSGPGSGWRLQVFSIAVGRKAPWTEAGQKMDIESRMGPSAPQIFLNRAHPQIKTFQLRRYFVIRPPGKYIIRATRWVGVEGKKQLILMGTNLLELDIDRDGQVSWKTRNVAFPRPIPRKIPPVPTVSLSQIPKTGPIAALARLADAIKRGDVRAAHRLVYVTPNGVHCLRVVDEEIALRRLARELKKHFGAEARDRFEATSSTISPKATESILRHVDLRTLKIDGHTAEIGEWMFSYALWRWLPDANVYFRRVEGHWLLSDGTVRYPRHSPFRIWDRLLKVQTLIYDSLRHEVIAGKINSPLEFDRELKARLAAAAKASTAEIMFYLGAHNRRVQARDLAEQKAQMAAMKKSQRQENGPEDGNTTRAAPGIK